MVEFPKIARQRLGRESESEHPDANLLSAFTENGLTQRERKQVLDHLSRCVACREIVALSAAEFEREALVAAAATPTRVGGAPSWWRSPMLHWGAVTAAALLVLITVGEHLRVREGERASAPAAVEYESAQQAVQTEAAPSKGEAKKSATAAPAERPPSTPHPKAMGDGSAGLADKLAINERATPPLASRTTAPAAPAPAPPPLKPHSELQAGEAAKSRSENVVVSGARAPADAGNTAGVASGVLNSPRAANSATAPLRTPDAIFAKPASSVARWSISGSGTLQRSLDAGRTWKEVPVAEGVNFRALAVMSNDIWAGGTGGVLFHSADGGEHWSRVPVRAGDRGASGDIVHIDFANSLQGVVSTSTGETWTTSDAGLTWRQQ
jgi:Photosynthesis system II assembly factor YCF48/Putative zinc-finger